jgi:type IV pilus modification protein PilV
MDTRDRKASQAGFTLVEALVAIVVLAVGLMAVSNLLLVAGSSNAVANRATAAAALATQQMERLKAAPFTDLVAGGGLDANVGATNDGCTTATGTFNCRSNVAVNGVGQITVRWLIQPAVGVANALFITVRAESNLPLMGARTRAEFTTLRVQS